MAIKNTRKDEATFARVLEQVAKELAMRRKQDEQLLDVQLSAWKIVDRHRAIVEFGIDIRSFTGYIVMEVLKAEAEKEAK